MHYGRVLKACRLDARASQEELAHRLHIQQADVSRIENDKKEPTLSLAIKWAQMTGNEDVIAALAIGIDVATIMTEMFNLQVVFINLKALARFMY